MWVFDIALMSDVISQCRRMPFQQKYDIVRLGEYCKALIEHLAGEELAPLVQEEDLERRKIYQQFEKEVQDFLKENPQFKEDSYRKSQEKRIIELANGNEKIKQLQDRRTELMKMDCLEKVTPVKIPVYQYDERLDETLKTAYFMGASLTTDGMSALMGLISRGVVIIKEDPSEEEVTTE